MKGPDIVSDKLESKLSYLFIGLIIVAAIVFHVLVNFVFNSDDSDLIVLVFSIMNPLITSSIAFLVAHIYRDAEVFGKAYLSLAAGYFAIFLGELTYFIYESVLQIEPYPSIADVFFFLQYPLILFHLNLNIKFFAPSVNKITKSIITAIPIVVVLAYIGFSAYESGFEELNFDFYYGLIFVTMSSATLSLALLGAITFKEGVLGKAWLLLLIGILCNTIGDTWYYNLEIFEQYDLMHPVNLFWYVGYWIVAYSLFKHRKEI